MSKEETDGKFIDNQGNWVTEKELFKGKTEEQITAIKFLQNIGTRVGCFKSEYVSAQGYRTVVAKKLSSINSREEAMASLGIDEDQIKEIEPVCFQGFDFGFKSLSDHSRSERNINQYRLAEGCYFSSYFEVTWLFFSSEQVYIYNFVFDTTSNSTSTQTLEYFYKDIVSFSTSITNKQQNVLEEGRAGGCFRKEVKRSYTSKMLKEARFVIRLPGSEFSCAYDEGDGTISSKVNAMKQKLREKKQA